MAKTFQTPGVYINETSSFPGSVVPVPTALPAFVGYTEKAVVKEQEVRHVPVRILSLQDYEQFFGGPNRPPAKVVAGTKGPLRKRGSETRFLLYDSLQFYFANGGGACYIVSVGPYDQLRAEDFFGELEKEESQTPAWKGIDALRSETESTLLLVPDAVLLPAAECYALQQRMLDHCAAQRRRFAILDVWGGDRARNNPDGDVIDQFRENIRDNLSWGAAYYPWLHTNIAGSAPAGAGDPEKGTILPPSGALAGIYCQTDANEGVFKAPANVSIAEAIRPTVPLNDQAQEDLNTPLDGKAINALRVFTGRGLLVWGARTLDGNNNDWRYVPVRRTLIFIEQSLKLSISAYAFSANVPATWTAVKAIAENFLTNFWTAGGLAGAKPQDAFAVQVGLGSTMTQQDILEGRMRIQVMVAVVRPAEFIVISLEQRMQEG